MTKVASQAYSSGMLSTAMAWVSVSLQIMRGKAELAIFCCADFAAAVASGSNRYLFSA